MNWQDLEESDEEQEHQPVQKSVVSKASKPAAEKKSSAPGKPQEKKAGVAVPKEKHIGKNVFACEDLEVEDSHEKEPADVPEKAGKKDNALSDLLSNFNEFIGYH